MVQSCSFVFSLHLFSNVIGCFLLWGKGRQVLVLPGRNDPVPIPANFHDFLPLIMSLFSLQLKESSVSSAFYLAATHSIDQSTSNLAVHFELLLCVQSGVRHCRGNRRKKITSAYRKPKILLEITWRWKKFREAL